VTLEYAQSAEDLAFLLAHDTDPFNRWDAGQRLASERIFAALKGKVSCTDLSAGWQAIFEDESLDGSFRAQCASLPGLLELLGRMDPTDPTALHAAREQVQTGAAAPLRPMLRKICEKTGVLAGLDRKSRNARRLRNHALGLWASLGDDEAFVMADRQFATATTMTDSLAALSVLCRRADAKRETALANFENRWKSNDLVMDKWFAVQASSDAPDTLERVEILTKHPAFTLTNPNRLRSVVAAFANNNPVWFHHPSLRGHAFVARMTAATDQLNLQVAARLATVFNPWRRYVPHLGNSMRASIETLLAAKPSRDTREILERALRG
jgi:aminopeptidase N